VVVDSIEVVLDVAFEHEDLSRVVSADLLGERVETT